MQKFRKLPTHILRDDCFESIIKGWKPGSFLEIGPGSGGTTELFLKKGYTGTCFDISKESRDILAANLKRYAQNLRIIEDLKLAGKESFDYLFIFDVIEHIKDDADSLKEFTKYLKKGGTILISVPAHKKRFGKSDELMGHFRRYEKNELRDLLKRCGYGQVEILNYGFPLVCITLFAINLLYGVSGKGVARDYGPLSPEERTRKSGFASPDAAGRLSFLFNKFTLLPFILLQRLFLRKDWGVAYIAYAKKT